MCKEREKMVKAGKQAITSQAQQNEINSYGLSFYIIDCVHKECAPFMLLSVFAKFLIYAGAIS